MFQHTYPLDGHLNFVPVPQIPRWIHAVSYPRRCAGGKNASRLDSRALAAMCNELWHRENHMFRAAVLA